ncbi:Fibrinogen binding protein, putative [Angomonas deanei]|uniref:Fibrinogen binding protein, putative n=1 Tax=Angomonas deanei TaxID=59799 RepID=A0A7G2CR00_9TRYP|nr:Fibrinogen binding protein, putative [Angomonas deanei]
MSDTPADGPTPDPIIIVPLVRHQGDSAKKKKKSRLGEVVTLAAPASTDVEETPKHETGAQREAEALAQREAEALAQREAEALAQREAEALAQREAEALAQREAEALAQREAEALAQREAEALAQREAEALAQREAEALAQREAEALAQREAEALAQREAEALAQREAEALAQREAEALAQREAEALAQREAEALAQREAEALAQREAEALAQREAEALAQREAEALAQREAEALAQREAEALAQREAEALAQREAEALAQREAEALAQREAEALAQREVLSSLLDSLLGHGSPSPLTSSVALCQQWQHKFDQATNFTSVFYHFVHYLQDNVPQLRMREEVIDHTPIDKWRTVLQSRLQSTWQSIGKNSKRRHGNENSVLEEDIQESFSCNGNHNTSEKMRSILMGGLEGNHPHNNNEKEAFFRSLLTNIIYNDEMLKSEETMTKTMKTEFQKVDQLFQNQLDNNNNGFCFEEYNKILWARTECLVALRASAAVVVFCKTCLE